MTIERGLLGVRFFAPFDKFTQGEVHTFENMRRVDKQTGGLYGDSAVRQRNAASSINFASFNGLDVAAYMDLYSQWHWLAVIEVEIGCDDFVTRPPR